ncbi:MAG: hypothetical protein DMF60_12925 [Acidobacteria bacterium]|nr:MAG: hypothetical protein DMF60_12925 [Acidobacteriota bacterium]
MDDENLPGANDRRLTVQQADCYQMINPLCATQSQEEKKLQLAARAGTRGRQAFADDGSDMRVLFCITEVSRFKGYPLLWLSARL